jgi:hypothetical protein
MNISYAPMTVETVHESKSHRMINGLHLLKSLLVQRARPVSPGKPLGVHLPDRVWQRQSALFMCLSDPGYDKRT